MCHRVRLFFPSSLPPLPPSRSAPASGFPSPMLSRRGTRKALRVSRTSTVSSLQDPGGFGGFGSLPPTLGLVDSLYLSQTASPYSFSAAGGGAAGRAGPGGRRRQTSVPTWLHQDLDSGAATPGNIATPSRRSESSVNCDDSRSVYDIGEEAISVAVEGGADAPAVTSGASARQDKRVKLLLGGETSETASSISLDREPGDAGMVVVDLEPQPQPQSGEHEALSSAIRPAPVSAASRRALDSVPEVVASSPSHTSEVKVVFPSKRSVSPESVADDNGTRSSTAASESTARAAPPSDSHSSEPVARSALTTSSGGVTILLADVESTKAASSPGSLKQESEDQGDAVVKSDQHQPEAGPAEPPAVAAAPAAIQPADLAAENASPGAGKAAPLADAERPPESSATTGGEGADQSGARPRKSNKKRRK